MVISFAACGDIKEESSGMGMLTELTKSTDSKVVYYDSIQSLGIALYNKEIDEMAGMAECVAKHMVDTLDWAELQKGGALSAEKISFSIAVLKDRSDVFEAFEKAIETLETRGVLENLKEEYIDSFKKTGVIKEAPELPVYENGPVYYFGLTGDYPNIDYFTADGKATGLGKAILVEIAKLLRANIQIVVSNLDSKKGSLDTQYVDAVFTTTGYSYTGGNIINNYIIPDDVSITTPFFTDDRVSIVRK